MATLSATQLLPLRPVSSVKLRRAGFLIQSRNPNHRLFSSISCANQALCSRPNLSPSHETWTLRDICQGFVPEHVLQRQARIIFQLYVIVVVRSEWPILMAYSICRVEEVGYVIPTDIQRQALPTLFSGRDCILHAQVNLAPFCGDSCLKVLILISYCVIHTYHSWSRPYNVVPFVMNALVSSAMLGFHLWNHVIYIRMQYGVYDSLQT